MSITIFKNNFPTKKEKIVFIDANSFKQYESMNNAIRYFSMNRQICIFTNTTNFKELKDALIELSMFATIVIYTDPIFINKSFIQSVIPNYNPKGSVFIGNFDNQMNCKIANSIELYNSSLVHSYLFEN